MGRLTILLAATICLVHFVGAKYQHSRNNEQCKIKGVYPNNYFIRSDLCTKSNSEVTLKIGGQLGNWYNEPNDYCSCHESGWLRCNNHRHRSQFGKRSRSPSSRQNQQGISYEVNPKCYDGNSKNQSPGCTTKPVVLLEKNCRCYEQGWKRCQSYSSTKGTTARGPFKVGRTTPARGTTRRVGSTPARRTTGRVGTSAARPTTTARTTTTAAGPFREDENCKKKRVSASHYFIQSDLCTKSNSEVTIKNGGYLGRWADARNVGCYCHESGWLRCVNLDPRRRPKFGKRSRSPSSRQISQQGISYEENPKCYDGNSENRSPGCNRKIVVLVERDCRCHEQGWKRCENYSSTAGTTVGTTMSG